MVIFGLDLDTRTNYELKGNEPSRLLHTFWPPAHEQLNDTHVLCAYYFQMSSSTPHSFSLRYDSFVTDKKSYIVNHFPFQNNHLLPKRNYVVQGSEILQKQRVVRQRTERGIRVAEGEVGGSKVITRLRTALLGKRHRNHGIDGLNRQKDSPRLPHDCLQCPGGLREYKHCAQVESLVILTVKILIKLSLSGLSRYVIRHFRYGKETGPSLLSQRLLGLLLGTGKKNWPIGASPVTTPETVARPIRHQSPYRF